MDKKPFTDYELHKLDVGNAYNAGFEAGDYYVNTPGMTVDDVADAPPILKPVEEALQNYDLTVAQVEYDHEMFQSYYKGLLDGLVPKPRMEAVLT